MPLEKKGTKKEKVPSISDQEANEIGIDLYHYLYPLVLMDITRRVMTNIEPGKKPGKGPMNMFHHMPAFPPAGFRDVVRPNFDTLYSIVWMDLTKEPLIITVPDTAGRYYLLPMLDMWTDVFAVPGKRTSGTKEGKFAIVPPGWKGTLPKGVARIDSPTPYAWCIGRTQTNGPKDYDAVHKVQAGFQAVPLSNWGKEPRKVKVKIDPEIDMKTDPLNQTNSMSASDFFTYGAELMKVHPAHITDWPILTRAKRIGFVPGKAFDYEGLPPKTRKALDRAVPEALKIMKAKILTLARITNGWQVLSESVGVYGTSYLKRAVFAMIGLGANLPEDAIYPLVVHDANGDPVVGEKDYVIHFDKERLPPVGAFWSITMYDEEGFHVSNELDRFAIGDRDELKYNKDGSLDIYIQPVSPGKAKEPNWLPSPPKGDLALTMRLYSPKLEVLDGRWSPPPVVPVKGKKKR